MDDAARQETSGRQKHYVYMVCCANGTLYTGYMTNVSRRIDAHNTGRGARYTRSNNPVALIATWEFDSRPQALRAERSIKRLPHHQKLAMAEATDLVGEDRS